MKNLLEDYKEFTPKEWLKYGIVYPIGLIVACLLADYLSHI